jgi:hypothetical protein
MNTKDFIVGGNFKEKGYYYKFYFILPEFKKSRCRNITGGTHDSFKLSLPTKIVLTHNQLYSNILFSIFGFGIGLEIQSRT